MERSVTAGGREVGNPERKDQDKPDGCSTTLLNKTTSEIRDEDYRLYYSGPETRGTNRVGVALGKCLKEVMKIDYTNECVMMIRLKGRKENPVIIQTCMHTTKHPEQEIEINYIWRNLFRKNRRAHESY